MWMERLAEQKIEEAMEEGKFNNLKGKGKPIDLDSYFSMPPEWRAGHTLLKNAGVLPEEVQLLKEVEALKEQLSDCVDEEELRRLRKRITEKMLQYNLLMERRRRK